VGLTAACVGLTEGYLIILGPQLNAKISDFEVDERFLSWIGKGKIKIAVQIFTRLLY